MKSIELPNHVKVLFSRIAKENGFNDYLVEVKPGCNPGDGFLNQILGIALIENNSDKRLDAICKVASSNEKCRKEVHVELLFNNEAKFYTKCGPIFEKFQEEKNVPESDRFRSYPECYAAVTDVGKELIVLKDLRPEGFQMWNKAKPSPIDNVRLVMRELGKFHGLSFALKDQRPEQFAEFKQFKDYYKREFITGNTFAMFHTSFDRALDALKCEEHKIIMQHIKSNFAAYLNACLIDDARFGVLSHGDCWNNNIMYRFKEDGVAHDISFIDWQTMRFLSPALDLLFNLFTSTDKAFRDKEYENMIKCYYESLDRTMKLLGSDANKLFSFQNLKDELKMCGTYVLITAPMLIQICQADSSEACNLSEAFEKAAEEGGSVNMVTGLSGQGQIEHDRLVNEIFEDIVNLGYYRKIE